MHDACPHCGKVWAEESFRFCSGCGARVDRSPAGPPGYPATPPAQKSPVAAGLSSAFLPGLGQVYNGEAVKGLAIFLLFLAGLVFHVLPGLVVWLYAMYDAYSVAGKINSGAIGFRETRTLHVVLFIAFAVTVIVIALLIVAAFVMASLMSQLGTIGTGDVNRIVDTNGYF